MSKDTMSFCDGKYTVTSDSGALYAHRHGEPWNRDLTGDNLVYWMLVDALALKQERDELAESERSCREDNQKFLAEIDALSAERDALAAELKALREQEPVAVYKGHRHIPSDTKEFWGMADNHLPAGTHLYARPVLSRELTDKVIERLFDESAFQENEMRDAADYFAHEIERYLKGEGE